MCCVVCGVDDIVLGTSSSYVAEDIVFAAGVKMFGYRRTGASDISKSAARGSPTTGAQ